MTFLPLTWTKVRAGSYEAADRKGNSFLIRSSRVSGENRWNVYVNHQSQQDQRTLAAAKRYVEGIARKHSTALVSR